MPIYGLKVAEIMLGWKIIVICHLPFNDRVCGCKHIFSENSGSNTIEEDPTSEVIRSDVAPVPESDNSESNQPSAQLTLAEERARKFEKIKHNLANPLKPTQSEKSTKRDEKGTQEKSLLKTSGPRQQKEITVSFTPRFFPSAARESTAADEEAVSLSS